MTNKYPLWKGYDKLHWGEQKFLVQHCNPEVILSKSDKKKFERIMKKGQRLSAMKGNRRAGKLCGKKRRKRKGRK